jgi:hypothetical protein
LRPAASGRDRLNADVAFQALCSGLERHEIPRVFLSVLMLANAGEVKLEGVREGEVNEDFIVVLTENVPSSG